MYFEYKYNLLRVCCLFHITHLFILSFSNLIIKKYVTFFFNIKIKLPDKHNGAAQLKKKFLIELIKEILNKKLNKT